MAGSLHSHVDPQPLPAPHSNGKSRQVVTFDPGRDGVGGMSMDAGQCCERLSGAALAIAT